jgi:hypothetical protein
LKREISAAFILVGGPHDLLQHAVDAVADADVLLVALEVDVRRSFLHRVGEDAVDQLHHRRLVHRRGEGDRGHLLLGVRHHLDVVHLDLLEQIGDALVGLLVLAVDRLLEGEVPRDDGLDVQPGDELEVVDHPQVGGVGHRHRERAPHAAQRQHLVLRRDLGGDQLQDAGVQLHPLQVHGGHAVLAGQGAHQVLLGQEAELHQ